MPDYLTVNEIAKLLDVKPATVRRWLAGGHMPAYKVGRRDWRVRRVDFEAYCEKQGIAPEGKE
jgi:excisionase family DNA binding protein